MDIDVLEYPDPDSPDPDSPDPELTAYYDYISIDLVQPRIYRIDHSDRIYHSDRIDHPDLADLLL